MGTTMTNDNPKTWEELTTDERIKCLGPWIWDIKIQNRIIQSDLSDLCDLCDIKRQSESSASKCTAKSSWPVLVHMYISTALGVAWMVTAIGWMQ